MSVTVTKQQRVMNYLVKGKTHSQDSAQTMFGIGNLRATISDIRPTLEASGYSVVRTTGRKGETRYGLA